MPTDEMTAARTLADHLAGEFTGRPLALARHLTGDHAAGVVFPAPGGSRTLDRLHHTEHARTPLTAKDPR